MSATSPRQLPQSQPSATSPLKSTPKVVSASIVPRSATERNFGDREVLAEHEPVVVGGEQAHGRDPVRRRGPPRGRAHPSSPAPPMRTSNAAALSTEISGNEPRMKIRRSNASVDQRAAALEQGDQVLGAAVDLVGAAFAAEAAALAAVELDHQQRRRRARAAARAPPRTAPRPRPSSADGASSASSQAASRDGRPRPAPAICARPPAPSIVATTSAPSLAPWAMLTRPVGDRRRHGLRGRGGADRAPCPAISPVSAANSGSASRPAQVGAESPAPAAWDRPRSRAGFRVARAPLYCGRNLVPTLLAPSFRHDRAGRWLAECRPGRRPAADGGGRARRRGRSSAAATPGSGPPGR